MANDQEWVTTGEAARMLGVRSINTIKRLVREGRLTAIRPGGHYRVRAESVRRLVAEHLTTAPVPDARLDMRSAGTRAWLRSWARRHRVRRIRLFGSAARGELGPASDIDVAVEFEDGLRVGLFEMVDMQDELAERFGRPVDLGTLRSMRPNLRRSVERDLVTIYEG